MAAILLGVAGAAVGASIGGTFLGMSAASLGWIAGSAAGSLLFPSHTDVPPVFGPRLGDLKIQTSTYGTAVPRAFGTVRLAGNVIWAPPIVETATTTTVSRGGGKGGGGGGSTQTQTTYSYSADFAVALCEGPIIGISRIWANGKLIHNLSATATIGSVLASDRSFTVYTGSETQTADPLMEAAEGAGNVPGYRGTAHVVFDDMQLGEFGNRIPNMEFEVVVAGTSPALAESSMFSSVLSTSGRWLTPDGLVWNYTTSPWEVKLINPWSGSVLRTIAPATANRASPFAADNRNLWAKNYNGGVADVYLWRYDQFGNVTKFTADTSLGTLDVISYIDSSGNIWTCYGQSPIKIGSFDETITADHAAPTCVVTDLAAVNPFSGGAGFMANAGAISGRMYLQSITNIGTRGWGYINTATNAYTSLHTAAGLVQPRGIVDASGYIYTATTLDSDATSVFAKYDQDGVLQATLAASPALGATATIGLTWALDDDGNAWVQSGTKLFRIDIATWTLAQSGTLAANHTILSNTGEGFNVDNVLTSDNTAGAFTLYAVPSATLYTPGTADLDTTVSTLCLLSNLAASDIDVTNLTGVAVDGYVVASRGPIRGMIEPLMAAFFFDATESDNKIKFVRRGGASAVTIPLADLSAQEGNLGSTPDPFDLTRQQEMELPLELNVIYLNSANNYQPSQQSSRRITRNSQTKATIQLPIVMSDNKARQVADAMMYSAWQERMPGSFATSRKYAIYEPTDVVTVVSGNASQVVRLLQKDEGGNGIIRWKCVIEDSTVYTQAATGAAMTVPDNVVPLIGPTLFVPLDIALLREVDDDFGFYYGLSGAAGGWIGAQLYQSVDSGTSYNAVNDGLMLTGLTMGTAAAALGTAGVTASTNEKVDEINTVSVVLTSGTLSTITRNAMLAGGNVFLIGDEIMQAMVCTLTATLTYTLSRLLRGRLGTEWAMGTHLAGDRFIVLDDKLRTLPQTPNDLDQSYYYKPVSVGKTLAGTNALTFTDTAVRKKPVSPWHLSGGRSTALDLIVEWVRRTRDPDITWNTPTDPPLFETAERYAVDILNGAGLTVRTLEVTAQTATYTVAQQTTDFGSAQASIPVTVCQISPEFGRGYTIAGTL